MMKLEAMQSERYLGLIGLALACAALGLAASTRLSPEAIVHAGLDPRAGTVPNQPLARPAPDNQSAGASVVERLGTVPPTSRFNVYVNGFVPELVDESFGAVIESTLPIAVERAMYSNAFGTIWAAGTNATATRLP